jgi:hypothetical protein
MLEWVSERQAEREALGRWLQETFGSSLTTARLIIDFLHKASLLHVTGAVVALTPYAARWLTSLDHTYLVAILHARIQFIGEMIAAFRQPLDTDELLAIANGCAGYPP